MPEIAGEKLDSPLFAWLSWLLQILRWPCRVTWISWWIANLRRSARIRKYSLVRTCKAAMQMLILFATWSGSALAEDFTVELPLLDGQYDARPFLEKVSGRMTPSSAPQLYPWGRGPRVALQILQFQGVIKEFDETDERVRITFSPEARSELRRALTPPRLINADGIAGHELIAVFIHGLEGDETTFSRLAGALTTDGWFPLIFCYPNDGPVHIPADFLLKELRDLRRRNPRSRVVVIAHSFGGLVAWDVISKSAQIGISDFIAVGVPFRGSSLTGFHAELEVAEAFARALRGNIAALDIVSDGQGEAIEYLRRTSSSRDKILARRLPVSVRLHVVAGSGGPIDPAERDSLVRMVDQWLAKQRFSEMLASNLRSVISSDEIYHGRGDGAVSLESATAVSPWATKQVFDRSHTGLLNVQEDDDEVLQWIRARLMPSVD